jgi:hypothetical protein
MVFAKGVTIGIPWHLYPVSMAGKYTDETNRWARFVHVPQHLVRVFLHDDLVTGVIRF